MNDIFSTVLTNTFSHTQFKNRARILKADLLKKLFGGENETISLTASEQNFLKSLPVTLFQNFNKENVYQIFTDLEAEVSKLPTLTIYLTFEPDEQMISVIGTYARKLFGGSLMLDVKYDPSLIAGTALVWKGVIKDYSLRAKINERKEEILENFKKFLR